MIEGDARDEGALIRALDGCDAVVSSLGTHRVSMLFSDKSSTDERPGS